MTVIAGPTDDHPEDAVLYTAFGGPKAEREPGDFSLGVVCKDHLELWKALVGRTMTCEDQFSELEGHVGYCEDCGKAQDDLRASLRFWSEHAITSQDCELIPNSQDPELRNKRSKGSLFNSVARPGERLRWTCDTCNENLLCPWAYNPFNVDDCCMPKAVVPNGYKAKGM